MDETTYRGNPEHRRLAEQAMRYLATPEIARRFETSGVLLADLEQQSEPLHVTVVGRSDDPLARGLLLAARGDPSGYKRIELLDRRAGPLRNLGVEFPPLAKAAAFVRSGKRCSAPAFAPEELRARIARLAPKALATRLAPSSVP
jgi:hypothetical protein